MANETTSTATQTAPTYAPGTPSWVDLATPDVEAATRFYNQIFGWTSQDLGEEAGHYNMFFRNGKMVAAANTPKRDGSVTRVLSTRGRAGATWRRQPRHVLQLRARAAAGQMSGS